MGKPVTVDSDDLEALLFSTGGIKAIEDALQQRSEDPLVLQAKPRLTAAHDRLTAEWRRQLRGPGYPGNPTALNEPLDVTARAALRRFVIPPQQGARWWEGWRKAVTLFPWLAAKIPAAPAPRFYTEIRGDIMHRRPAGFDGLVSRGLAEYGTVHEIFAWGDSQERTRIDHPIQAVRLTERGRQALAKLLGIHPGH